MNRILLVALFTLSAALPLSAFGPFHHGDLSHTMNSTFNSTNNTEPHGLWDIAPDARQVSLRDLRYEGSGCPPGSVAAKLQDNQINFEFARLSVTKGNHSLNHDDYTECFANFTVHVPHGWSYRLSSHEVDGFVEIPRHITMNLNVGTQFLDVPMASDTVKNFTITYRGPREKSFSGGAGWGGISRPAGAGLDDSQKRHSWSRCGKSQKMSLDTFMRLDGPQGTPHAYAGGDKSPHGRVEQDLYLVWKKCIR